MTLPSPVPARDPTGHKGSFGTVCIVGGCDESQSRMIGAPALAALGAVRAGAGLVRLAMPERVLSEALTIAPFATGVPIAHDADPGGWTRIIQEQAQSCSCLAVGPGLGGGAHVQAAALASVQVEDAYVVLDADALNALAQMPEIHRDFRAPAVLTPHPGEYRRLAASLRITIDPADPERRPAAAEELAQRLGSVVVLKGPHTVVTDGQRTWVCRRGHACLGTGGTGDVLTGLIAGLVAQFVPRPTPMPTPIRDPSRWMDLFGAACAGVEAHALAGELWAQTHSASGGLVIEELAALVPRALESLRASA